MKKRVLAIAMTLAMTLSLLPVSALATETGETPEEETSTVNSIQETNSSENAENQDQELTADVEIDEDTQVTEGDSVENFVAKIGDMPYATLQGAINAASDNATIVLQDDVVLDTCITISKTITLDLAGNTISNTEAVWDNEGKIWSLVRVEGNGNLTLTGDGTLRALEDDCYAVDIVDGGQCTIENGTYVGNIHAVYVFNGSLIVNGGTFSVQQKYSTERPDEYVLNCYDANYNNKSASITVTGGTFANFDPSNCYAEGEGTNFCADGYVSVQNGDQYVVMPIKDAAVAQVNDEYYLTLQEAVDAAEKLEESAENLVTITLLRDITGGAVTFDQSGNYLLDLNNNTYTSNDKNDVIKVMAGNMNLKIQNGGLQGDGKSATTYGLYVYSGNCDNVTVTLDYVNLDVTDQALGVQGMNSNNNLIVKNSVITSDTTAIYFPPKSGKLTIENSEITGFNNAIVIKGGETEISGDNTKILATGPADEIDYPYEGDPNNPESFPHSGSAVYVESGYNDRDIVVNIKGGQLNSRQDQAIRLFLEPNVPVTVKRDIIITGGYFTSDPSDYLAKNYYAVASDKDGYAYMVTDEQPTEAPVIVTENVEAEVAEGANMTSEDRNAVSAVINSASVSGVADALTNDSKDKIAIAAGISNEDLKNPNKTVVIEIGVNVTATSADLSEDNATVTYQVTPVATVKVNGEEQPGKVSVPNSYLNGQKFTVRLPLPKGLKDPQEVMHIADNGTRERFTGSELNIEPNWVEVNISHFSELIVNAKKTVAAKIGNTEYGTLQEAVNAAASGATITLQQDCDEPITITGKSVTIDRNTHQYDSTKITLGSRCEMTDNGKNIVITYTAPTHSSDSDSGSDSGDYLISVDRVSGGRVTVQPGRADKGETVTITVYPNDGYELDELVVTDSRGNEIDLDARSATRFTFTMPGGKVTVEASFVREGGQPQVPQTTFADVPASAWYYNAVEYVYENGLMSGVSGGRFAPDDTLTRAMLVQTLYAMEGRPASASAGFADVASGDWYASAVNWAAANGVVSGVSETGFGPNNALTREQLALILYRFAQYKGYDVTGTSDLAAYADGSSVSGWAAEAMGWAVDAGLISGVGGNQIAPTGTASRAQVAQILMNFCENVAR